MTAAAVSVARGVGVPGLATDEWAARLLPGPLSALVRACELPGARAFLRCASMGTVDHLALRTAALDSALLESGCEQLVILGAGLDARVLRLPELRDHEVFEVDHPDTQCIKRRAVEPAPSGLHFVGVDFARDSLEDALEQAGHDTTRSTFFLWEGVTMYLPASATQATVDVIRERAAAGSVFAFTYVVPELLPGLPRSLRTAVLAGFRVLGESMIGAMSIERARALAQGAGFVIRRDSSNVDWARDFVRSPMPSYLYRGERLLVARRE